MLHSTYHHKETNEDPKTSAVFENLMLLPDNVFWHLLRQSCFSNDVMPVYSGQLLSYDFWPHWDRTGTDNTNYVEPDLFLEFELFDVIIEAKYGDVVDRINRMHGSETIVLGSQQYTSKDGKGKADVFANAIKHDFRSPSPTTRWSDVIKMK